MNNQIYHIKLLNSDEIICELMPSTNKDEYRVKNPLLIQDVVDSSTGISAIVLVDYVPFTEDKSSVFINKDSILMKSKIGTAMCDYYTASLDYSISIGNADILFKIQSAANRLAKYMESKKDPFTTSETESNVIPITYLEDTIDTEEEDIDLDEIFASEEVTSNTTIH